MYEFMKNNGLPCGNWAGIWRADQGYTYPDKAINAALVAVSKNMTTANNLLVVKMCHISMGHYDSSWVVPNLEALGTDSERPSPLGINRLLNARRRLLVLLSSAHTPLASLVVIVCPFVLAFNFNA